MIFWLVAVLLTAGAALSVLVPFSRRAPVVAGGTDIEVYRDQLAELDREIADGRLGAVEAEEARAEIGRRILRAASGAGLGGAASPGNMSRVLAFAAVVSVPLVSWGLYALIGSPDLPSQPLAARLTEDPAQAPIEELVARAEAHLAANPEDGHGWDVLAPVYFRIERYPDAVAAYRKAISLVGDTADREAGLGEALVGANGGTVDAQAHAALERALQLDPNQPKARFLLASELAQQGRIQDAASAWQAMLAVLPAESPWRAPVEAALTEAARRLAAGPQPGPTQADVDAASQMSADDRGAMIASMVERLDERLKQNPRDPEGWQRLVRSYVVMGKPEQARDALSRGIEALGATSPEANALETLAQSLGVARTQ